MKFLHRFLWCAASLSFFANDARAASFIVADLSTAATGLAASPAGSAVSQDQITRNLNNREGLTPGAPILITVRSTDPFRWGGSLNYSPGTLTISISATLTLVMGANTASSTISVLNVYPNIVEGSEGPVSGSLQSSGIFDFSLVVPWEADLTTAVFSLRQNSTLTGTSAGTFSSSMVMAAGAQTGGPVTVETGSIPEPKASAFLLCALIVCSLRFPGRK